MSKRMYELVVIAMLMMSFFCVPCQDVKACRTNSAASSMSDESLQQKINDLAGMSAIGYVPFWRVGLTKEGLDVGMPQIQVNHFPYEEIEETPTGWIIKSRSQDVVFTLHIHKAPGRCSLSRQWYPYQSVLTIKIAGQAEQIYKGTAIGKGQKPLPPHPKDGKQPFKQVKKNKQEVYSMLDHLKFALMDKDMDDVAQYIHYPLRVNSSSAASVVINNRQMFGDRFSAIFNPATIQSILSCKYQEIYEREGSVGVGNGLMILTMFNGKLLISTINKN